MGQAGEQFDAMFREAVKDIRNSIHESFFGRPEGAAELGAPGNPTPQLVTEGIKEAQPESFDTMLDNHAARSSEAEQEMER